MRKESSALLDSFQSDGKLNQCNFIASHECRVSVLRMLRVLVSPVARMPHCAYHVVGHLALEAIEYAIRGQFHKGLSTCTTSEF